MNISFSENILDVTDLPPNFQPTVGNRILIVTNEFDGLFKNGGIGTANTGLAHALAEGGYDVTVGYVGFVSSDPNDIANALAQRARFALKNILLDFIPSPSNIYQAYQDARSTSFAVYYYILKNKFDIIYFNDCGGHAYYSVLAKKSGMLTSNPSIYIVMHGPHEWLHEINFVPYYNNQPIIISYIEKRSVELADAVICPSRYLLEWLKNKGWIFPQNLFIAQNIVNVGNVSRLSVEGRAIPATEVVFFGRQEVRKGLKLFCDSIDLLQGNRKHSNVPITIMGKFSIVDGLHSGCYVLERSRGWANPVDFSVKLGQQEAVAYIAKPGRLPVIPSLAENSPCVVAECAQLGIPFIATDSGGTRELLRQEDWNGCLVRVDSMSLANKIGEAIDSGISPAELAVPQDRVREQWLRFHQPAPKRGGAAQAKKSDTRLPLVSACLIHHNNPRHLMQAFDSVLSQTYANLELVIVDDGSTDRRSIDILDGIGKEKYKIDVSIVYQENLYLGAARNTAVSHANGEYVLFLDDDNVWMPDCVENMIKTALNLKCDIVTGVSHHFRHDNRPGKGDDRVDYLPIGACAELGAFENCFGDANALVSRSVFQRLGGFHTDHGQSVEDWQLFASAVLKGFRLEVCPAPTFWYRVRSTGMLNKSNLLQNQRRILSLYSPYRIEHIVNYIEGLLRTKEEYIERSRFITEKYSNKTHESLVRISGGEPNTIDAINGFVDFMLDAGFTSEALNFSIRNGAELLASTTLRARRALRAEALEAIRQPRAELEETIELNDEVLPRVSILSGLGAHEFGALKGGAFQHRLHANGVVAVAAGVVPPGSIRVEADVRLSQKSGVSVEACVLVREHEEMEIGLESAGDWRQLRDGPVELVAHLQDAFDDPKDLFFAIRVAPGSAVPRCEVEWQSVRAVVVSNPLKRRGTGAQLRLVDRI